MRMSDKEIAMQITLKAMETGFIKAGKPEAHHNENYDISNDFSVKQVCEFYETVLEAVISGSKKD